MLVKDLVDRYLSYQARHWTEATVKYYTQGLKWLKRDLGDREWNQLERDEVIAGLDRANTNPKTGSAWKNETIRRNITALEQIQKFGLDQYDLDIVMRPRDLKKPPGTKREAIPTDEELLSIFEAGEKHSVALGLAFRSLAASGMRPGELCRANIADLSDERDLILLRKHKTMRKTGKPKRVALGDGLKILVKSAVKDRTEGPIWLDETGKRWKEAKLSRLFRERKNRLGLNPDLVLYSLRHWKGTQVARKFGIHAAMHVLGHSQVTTTQRYLHPNDDDARTWQDC